MKKFGKILEQIRGNTEFDENQLKNCDLSLMDQTNEIQIQNVSDQIQENQTNTTIDHVDVIGKKKDDLKNLEKQMNIQNQ